MSTLILDSEGYAELMHNLRTIETLAVAGRINGSSLEACESITKIAANAKLHVMDHVYIRNEAEKDEKEGNDVEN